MAALRGNPRFRRAVFVDTSAFYILVDDQDVGHASATALLRSIRRDDRDLVTSNLVVAETHALVLRRHGRHVALQYLRGVQAGLAETVRGTEDDEVQAVAIIEQYTDKAFSYTDATSFAVMDRLGITTAFSFDRRVRQYGMTTLGLDG